MYAKVGLDDLTTTVPKALQDAWTRYMELEIELKEAREAMMVPIHKKKELLERFSQRLGVMSSQNRAQQALADAEDRLEKWLKDRLPAHQQKIDEVTLSMSKQLGLINGLLEAEERKRSESDTADQALDFLAGEMDALVLDAKATSLEFVIVIDVIPGCKIYFIP